MVTVKLWLRLHPRKAIASALALTLALSAAGWWIWRPFDLPFVDAKVGKLSKQSRKDRPVAALPPASPVAGKAEGASAASAAVPASDTKVAAAGLPAGGEGPALPAGGSSPSGVPPAPPATGAGDPAGKPPVAPVGKDGAGQDRSTARPILVEHQGKTAPLDVAQIMAMQRTHAERRLYDRVLQLARNGVIQKQGGSRDGRLGLAPLPPSGESGLSTLLGSSTAAAVNSVPSGIPQGPGTDPGADSAVRPVAAMQNVPRLVSIYARGDVQIAEFKMGNGRRIDLEADDVYMGRQLLRIDEGGVLFGPSVGLATSRQLYLAIGATLMLEVPGGPDRQ